MRIIKGTQAITVDHPVILLFGQPGICKSSLGYSADDPLLIDTDKGSHRAANRRDTAVVDRWADIEAATADDVIKDYKTLVPDTIGRVLDMLSVDIITRDPKFARGNSLTLPGFGELKGSFRNWINRLRSLGKDIVLIAHAKEDKNGDEMIWRPDITGSSYDEVMKIADFVGFVYMRGKDRVLDFNPTDRWVGKNPAGWKPIVVPPVERATNLLANLFAEGRAALGSISEESARVLAAVETWRTNIANLTTADECTHVIGAINQAPPIVAVQVKRLLAEHAKALGCTFDAKVKKFTGGPAKRETPATPVLLPQDEPATVGELGF